MKNNNVFVLPCNECNGMCCGPIPVTHKELKRLSKKIKSMPSKLVTRLKNQKREKNTCIFYDTEKRCCGVYSARPEICRMYGYYEGLICYKNPEIAIKDNAAGKRNLFKKLGTASPVGVLSLNIKWDYFEKK